jgi:hypothetical protein
MRHVFTLIVVLVGGMAGLLCSWHGAAAWPAAGVSAPALAVVPIEKVGYWKRYCKFNDCSGNAVVNGDADVDVPAPALNPPIIAIVPVRPVSCGEYRYWDGERCVDARYHNPYVGPR